MASPDLYFKNTTPPRILIAGNSKNWQSQAIKYALTFHFPDFEKPSRKRTRISPIVNSEKELHDFIFEYQELFDNSYWRVVDLSQQKPKITTHSPQYEATRKDFVDVEWEFVIGYFAHPLLQLKLRQWADSTERPLIISLCYSEQEKNRSIAEKIRRRLPYSVRFDIIEWNSETESRRMSDLIVMARYLNYFHKISLENMQMPEELPEEEVIKAWNELTDDRMRRSNIYNVMSFPIKMEILGYEYKQHKVFDALFDDEIELLTPVEHNRWSVDRMIQGFRPCTDEERKKIEDDLRRRLSDQTYARNNPISLKQKYKTELLADFDLCAFSDLGVDEKGLPVSLYDRDLVAAIPVILNALYFYRHGQTLSS